MNTALFIDLPNFYSRLLKSGIIKESSLLKGYFCDWLDFDLLAESLTESFSGIWVFYSGEKIGPSSERIKEAEFKSYIRRINSLKGVTAHNVNIPNEQREPFTFNCQYCNKENVAESKGEKGIDASLIVHLFDTMDAWDIAYLLSGDADFVPAVASLRRRGKIVIGAGFLSNAAPALVRECYDYIDLADVFIKDDLAAYTMFKKGGIIHKWFTSEVRPQLGYNASEDLSLIVQLEPAMVFDPASVFLRIKGSIDLTKRHQQIEEFVVNFPNYAHLARLTGRYDFNISHLIWKGVARRLQTLNSISGVKVEEINFTSLLYTMVYKHNPDKDVYELLTPS